MQTLFGASGQVFIVWWAVEKDTSKTRLGIDTNKASLFFLDNHETKTQQRLCAGGGCAALLFQKSGLRPCLAML